MPKGHDLSEAIFSLTFSIVLNWQAVIWVEFTAGIFLSLLLGFGEGRDEFVPNIEICLNYVMSQPRKQHVI
jgi:hypothetical protein